MSNTETTPAAAAPAKTNKEEIAEMRSGFVCALLELASAIETKVGIEFIANSYREIGKGLELLEALEAKEAGAPPA